MEEHYQTFSNALRRLLHSDDLRTRFMSLKTSDEVRTTLGISEAMAIELKNVLLELESAPVAEPPQAGPPSGETPNKLRDEAISTMDSTRQFLDNSFGQLQTAFRVSLLMSLTLFFVGIAFLVLAAIRSVTAPEAAASTAVVGGIGVVQIVALFYKNPLKEVGRAVSNAQQSKMAIMTYMLGVSLVGESVFNARPTEEANRRLEALTRYVIETLERFVENGPAKAPATAPPDGS